LAKHSLEILGVCYRCSMKDLFDGLLK
jgi:hypothetical protein